MNYLNDITPFINAGLYLVPIPKEEGKPTKAPQGNNAKGWNSLRSAQNKNGYTNNIDDLSGCDGFNFGLYHRASNTLSFDIDDMAEALKVFSELVGDNTLPDWLNNPDRVEIKSPTPNRGKLLFKLPDSLTTLKMHKFSHNGETIFELRCGNCQDVIYGEHPNGGRYSFIGNPQTIPDAPEVLIDMLTNWDDWKPCFESVLSPPETPPRTSKAQKTPAPEGARDAIAEFNQSWSYTAILTRNGYRQVNNDRFIRPNSKSNAPGVAIMRDCVDGIERIYSHGGDALSDGLPHDAFDCYKLLECGGDEDEALKWNEELTKHNQQLFRKNESHKIESISVDADIDALNLANDYPVFDDSKYYGIAGELASLATENSEADKVAVYFSFLTASAAMFGCYKNLQVGDSQHYGRLFVALVGASSRARKGTSFKPVEKIIRKVEEMYFKTSGDLLIEKMVITNGGLSSAEGLIYAVRDESEETRGKDGTPIWFGVEDKRLLVVEEELGGVFKVAQREGNQLSPILRKAWDGGTLAPMTKNNRMCATDPHINVIGHITQVELKELLSNSDIYNGLVNRFLWACVRRTNVLAFPKPMDSNKVMALAIRLTKALSNSKESAEIKLNEEARALWNIQYYIVSKDSHGIIGAVTARNEAQVLRVAIVFCLLDGVNEITKEHIEAAIAVINYSMASCEFIFVTPSEDSPDAQKLLSSLNEKAMTQTEISRLFNGNKSKSQLTELLTDLQTLNKIYKKKTPNSKKIIWEKIKKQQVNSA
jgi:hypothetical protein